MSVEVTIEGLDKLMELVDPGRFLNEMDKAVNRAGEFLRDETKRLPPVSGPRDGYEAKGLPVDSGRMRQSIQKKRLGMLAIEVFAPVNYSEFVHSGTSKVPGRPFFRWVLEDFGALEKVEIMLQGAMDRAMKV